MAIQPKKSASKPAKKPAKKAVYGQVLHCYVNRSDPVERRLFAVALKGQQRWGMKASSTIKEAIRAWLDKIGDDPRAVPLGMIEIVDLADVLKAAKVVVDDSPEAKYPLLNVYAGDAAEFALLARLDPIARFGPTKSHLIKVALSQHYEREIRLRAGEMEKA